MVAKADGVVGDKERYVVKCLTEALESSPDPPGAPDGVSAANLSSPCPLCGAGKHILDVLQLAC